jgi:hypothetical protein
MGNMRQMIGQLVERVEIPVSGDAGAIAKKISDDIVEKLSKSNVYVVAEVRDQKGVWMASGTVVRMSRFIANAKPPLVSVRIVDFSTDRNWARNEGVEL